MQAIGRIAGNGLEADAADMILADFDTTGEHDLALMAAAPPACGRVVPGPVADAGLVYFHEPAQRITLWIDHRLPELAA